MDRPYSIEYPEASGPPQLTTFYSFKGGVGRTQSLYNVGVRLAALRRKVMMVDVDLEAPGLSIGALDDRERNSKDGFAEIASDLLLELDVAIAEGDPDLFAEVVADYQTRLDRALHVIDVPMPPRQEGLAERLRDEVGVTDLPTGSLTLLSSGRIDPDYPRKMIDVQIDEAFEHDLSDDQQDRLPELLDAAGLTLPGVPDNLGLVFTAVFRYLLRHATDPKTEDQFRHVLIDSRSGLADVGGLCLRGLPDTRVVLSGLNKQNLEGTRMVLNTLSREERSDNELIVVFSPVPEGEANLVENRLNTARETLTFRDANGMDQILDEDDESQIQLLHYHPRIALEETPFIESFHRRTRIYEEYEKLTDHLLALTDSDAESLVTRALNRFQNEETHENYPYRHLVCDLLPVSFVDEERVEFVVEGFCSQLNRSEQYEKEALPLFDLWVALAPEEDRVLGTTANYYSATGGKLASGVEEAEIFFQRSFELNERITRRSSQEERAWYSWGTDLGRFAQLIRDEDSEYAESLYKKAFDKYEHATEIDPEDHQAWYNWGTHLGNLAQLVKDKDPQYAKTLYHEAAEKHQQAIEIKSDKHESWGNWGINLVSIAQLIGEESTQKAKSLYQEAFEKFEKVTEIKPDDYKAWYNWATYLSEYARLVQDLQDSDFDHVQALYEEALGKYRKAVEINSGKKEAWHNWGTDLARLAKLIQKENPEEANSHYRKAFEKFQEAVELDPDDDQTWRNWGIYLTGLTQLVTSENQNEEAFEVLSNAIDNFRDSLPNDESFHAFFWLILALAERDQNGDIEEAVDHLQTFLDENPDYVTAFDEEEAVRAHPELREILDEYREQIDEDELEEADAPDELDTPDLSE